MKYFWTYFTALLLFIAQTTVGRYISICKIMPNLVLVYAVCFSMYNFPVRSAVLCVVCGILTDAYSAVPMGTNALLFMYIGLAVSNFAGSLMKRSGWTVLLGVMIVSALYQTLFLVFGYVVHGNASFLYGFLRIVLPGTLYDGVVALFMSAWARWLSEEQIRGF